MLKLLFVGTAGLLGTAARYRLAAAAARRYGGSFPFGTPAVNAAGCFMTRRLFRLFEARFAAGESARAVVFAGFLGGFKTFSAYGLQVFALLRDGGAGRAALYAAPSNVLGVLPVRCGFAAGRDFGGAS